MSSKKSISQHQFISSHLGKKSFKFQVRDRINYLDKYCDNKPTFCIKLYNKDFDKYVIANSNSLISKFIIKHNISKGANIFIYHIRKNTSSQGTSYYHFDILCKINGDKIIESSNYFTINNISNLFTNKHKVIHYRTTIKSSSYNTNYDKNKPETEDNKKFILVDKDVIFTEDYEVYELKNDEYSNIIKNILDNHNITSKSTLKIVLCSCKDKCNYKLKENYILEKIEIPTKNEDSTESDTDSDIDINEFI